MIRSWDNATAHLLDNFGKHLQSGIVLCWNPNPVNTRTMEATAEFVSDLTLLQQGRFITLWDFSSNDGRAVFRTLLGHALEVGQQRAVKNMVRWKLACMFEYLVNLESSQQNGQEKLIHCTADALVETMWGALQPKHEFTRN